MESENITKFFSFFLFLDWR